MQPVTRTTVPPTPFLKWAGGKRWLVHRYPELFDVEFERFVEPFLGSGAAFFNLAPQSALLSDCNGALIAAYRAVRDNWQKVLAKLRRHQKLHSTEHYYQVRQQSPRSDVAIAARLIYLNRTCWNGLYRVNKNGAFNVPIGTKTKVVLESDDFEVVSSLLDTVDLRTCDFEETIDTCGPGDFVFVDPPYTVKHDNNGFIKYNDSIFSWQDQVRLRDSISKAWQRGAKLLITNANHQSVVDLYSGLGISQTVCRASVIAGSSAARGRCNELVIKCL